MSPRPLVDIIAASRIVSSREAVVTALAAAIDVPVVRHYGKIDISDVIEGEAYQAPSIHIAVTRITSDDSADGQQDLKLDFTAFVVAEDQMIAGRMAYRDEIGYALALAILDILGDDSAARWGLDWIGPPDEARAQPLFTAISRMAKGLAFYSVTWRQTILAATYQPPAFFPPSDFGAPI